MKCRFSTVCGNGVALGDIATYIHNQINGTFNDIHDQLSELVDVLEIPNNGSITLVSFDEANMLIEDIGADPCDFPMFLADNAAAEKSVGFMRTHDGAIDKSPRHPRYAHAAEDHGGVADMADRHNDVLTEELLARSKRQADGIWFKKTATGYMVYSRTGKMPLSFRYMEKHPVDTEFNVWYQTHMSEGWKPCSGKCAGPSPPAWYHAHREDPPTITNELKRTGCIGFCRTARNAEKS